MGCSDSKPAEAVSNPKEVKPGAGHGAKGSQPAGKEKRTTPTVLDNAPDVRQSYVFDKVLGKGNFGIVHMVYDKATGQPWACKSISKRKLVTQDDVEDVRREVQILLHLAGHPNVVQLKGVYEDKGYVHMVMELCEGGELFDRIADKGHFSERQAAEVVRTIVSVVHHCHTMNVIHRDLKPENFLLTSKKPNGTLKATDFGLSRFFKDGQVLNDIVGSPFYVAPEVLRRQYGKEADIWSCGVILYILLCGWPPFHGDTTQKIFKNIMSKPLDLKSPPWPKITDAAKDCVRKMLARDPRKRLTAEEVLKHPWMQEHGVATDIMIPEVLVRMRQFTQMNKLKKNALKVFACSLPANDLAGLKEMFHSIDTDNSGTISVEELHEGLRKKGSHVDPREAQYIMDSIDVNGNSRIDYEEFLAATLHLTKLNREEQMINAFKFFDKDESGFITKDEIVRGLADLGEEANKDEVNAIMSQADKNGDGKIDYEEFCIMMRSNHLMELAAATRAIKTKMIVEPQLTKSFLVRGPPVDEGEEEEEENGRTSQPPMVKATA
uniref:Calcium-dependent protein kinase n=1 Tax=Dunaliella salina TaxID=3046 RepID=I3QJ82_DUNSA|nr:calcium-dependent protein kinase [Dunaliella salina]